MKTILKVINIVSVVIIGIALFVMLKVVLTPAGQSPSFLCYSIFSITSCSMEPTIHVDSLVVVKSVEDKEVKVDDVITF